MSSSSNSNNNPTANHVNTKIFPTFEVTKSGLNTIAIADAHHDKLSPTDAFKMLSEGPTPHIEKQGNNIVLTENTYNPNRDNELPSELKLSEEQLGKLLFGPQENTPDGKNYSHGISKLQETYEMSVCKKDEIITTIRRLLKKPKDEINLFLYIDCAIGMDKKMAEEAVTYNLSLESTAPTIINTIYLREHANDPVKQPLPTQGGSQLKLFQPNNTNDPKINFYYEYVPSYQNNYLLYPQWPDDKKDYVRENLLISRMNVFQGCNNVGEEYEFNIKAPYCITDPTTNNMFLFEKSDCEKNTISFGKKPDSIWNRIVENINSLSNYNKLKGNNKVLTIAKRFGDQGQMLSIFRESLKVKKFGDSNDTIELLSELIKGPNSYKSNVTHDRIAKYFALCTNTPALIFYRPKINQDGDSGAEIYIHKKYLDNSVKVNEAKKLKTEIINFNIVVPTINNDVFEKLKSIIVSLNVLTFEDTLNNKKLFYEKMEKLVLFFEIFKRIPLRQYFAYDDIATDIDKKKKDIENIKKKIMIISDPNENNNDEVNTYIKQIEEKYKEIKEIELNYNKNINVLKNFIKDVLNNIDEKKLSGAAKNIIEQYKLNYPGSLQNVKNGNYNGSYLWARLIFDNYIYFSGIIKSLVDNGLPSNKINNDDLENIKITIKEIIQKLINNILERKLIDSQDAGLFSMIRGRRGNKNAQWYKAINTIIINEHQKRQTVPEFDILLQTALGKRTTMDFISADGARAKKSAKTSPEFPLKKGGGGGNDDDDVVMSNSQQETQPIYVNDSENDSDGALTNLANLANQDEDDEIIAIAEGMNMDIEKENNTLEISNYFLLQIQEGIKELKYETFKIIYDLYQRPLTYNHIDNNTTPESSSSESSSFESSSFESSSSESSSASSSDDYTEEGREALRKAQEKKIEEEEALKKAKEIGKKLHSRAQQQQQQNTNIKRIEFIVRTLKNIDNSSSTKFEELFNEVINNDNINIEQFMEHFELPNKKFDKEEIVVAEALKELKEGDEKRKKKNEEEKQNNVYLYFSDIEKLQIECQAIIELFQNPGVWNRYMKEEKNHSTEDVAYYQSWLNLPDVKAVFEQYNNYKTVFENIEEFFILSGEPIIDHTDLKAYETLKVEKRGESSFSPMVRQSTIPSSGVGLSSELRTMSSFRTIGKKGKGELKPEQLDMGKDGGKEDGGKKGGRKKKRKTKKKRKHRRKKTRKRRKKTRKRKKSKKRKKRRKKRKTRKY